MKLIYTRNLLLSLLSLIILAACGSGDQPSALQRIESDISAIEAEAGTITEIDCPLEVYGETKGETYACGVYTVPVDYYNPQGETLNLAYTILYAASDDSEPDPIVYLAGGPGQSSMVAAGDSLYNMIISLQISSSMKQ